MRALIDAAIHSPRLVLLFLALILLSGGITYATIPKESDPDVPIPYINIYISLEGISPEDSERLLVRPVEQATRSIEGVKVVASTAGQGYGTVTLEFEAGLDSEKSLRAVRRKVDEIKGKLPAGADEPAVREFNVALFPVLTIVLSGPVPERALSQIARGLKDELLGVKGVLDVDVGGLREEMIEINVDPAKLEAYGLSQEELFTLFARNNRLIAAGVLESASGRFPVKLPGTLATIQDVQNLPVKVDGSRVVRFGDVATVTRAFKDANSLARFNGEPALTLEVKKRLGANIIETIDRVRALVALHQAHWPASVRVDYSQDRSHDIKDMLNELQNGVLLAVLLVIAVLVLAIGWRSAALVAVAIPGSFLAGILVLGLLHLTVNVIVLFALIMAVGMLVDDAIIVGEYADRKMAEGLPPKQAYREATHRMLWPIAASTAMRLVMFFPLLFWPGIAGDFMKYMPITLIATLTASLLMAVIFLPVLGGIWGKSGTDNRQALDHLAAAEIGDLASITGFTGWYLKLLARCVDSPRKTFATGVGLVLTVFVAYAFCNAGVEFFPETEPSNLRATVHGRGDLSVYEKDQLVREVENRILGMDGIKSLYAQSGRTGSNGRREAADQIGVVNIELGDWDKRRPAKRIMADIRSRMQSLPGVVVNIEQQQSGPSQGKPVDIELSPLLAQTVAQDNLRLAAATDAVRQGMEKVGGFTDVEDDRPLSGIEWQLDVDRAMAARYGADITQVGTAVQLVTTGILLGKTRPEDTEDEIDIRARYTLPGRNLGQLGALKISTPSGLVPIANFVEKRAAPKVTSIARNDGRRVFSITANVAPGKNVDAQVRALQTWFVAHPDARINEGIRVKFKGQNEDQAQAMAFLMKAFIAGILMMVMVLLAQFNSFYQTLLVLSAAVFAIGAVLLGLMILRAPLGIVMGGVGIIALAGIIVNNNIILIDTYNHLLAEGKPAREALLRTGAMRLRPVLLTAGTAILGLLPMAFGMTLDLVHREIIVGAPGAQFWVQLASAVAGGLAFATPITLLLTPALLKWREESEARKKARRQAGKQYDASTGSELGQF